LRGESTSEKTRSVESLRLRNSIIVGNSGVNWICPSADQRGVSRPVDGDLDGFAHRDMGPVEHLPEPTGPLPLLLGCVLLARPGRSWKASPTASRA